MNCSSGQGNGGWTDWRKFLQKPQLNYWQKSSLCLQVCCPEMLMGSWGFPWGCPAVAARPQWVGQEEDQSRALGAGRTLSIKSPCKSPFLSSAPALLTPTNSWGSINRPVEKERERERKSGALGPEWDWRAVWGSRRVRVMRWTRQTPSQCPLSSCCIANTLQNGRVLKEHLVLYLQAAQQQQSRW